MINADAARLMAELVAQTKNRADPDELATVEFLIKEAISHGESSLNISFALSQGTIKELIDLGYDVTLLRRPDSPITISWN